MIGDLERQDKIVIGIGVLIPVLAAAALWNVSALPTLLLIDNVTQYVASATFLVSILFIYRVHALYGGEVGRALEVMGAGLLISSIWAPYVSWHILGAPNPLGPAWIGLSPEWWGTFFHTVIATGYGVVGYGYYLFWRDAGPAETPPSQI